MNQPVEDFPYPLGRVTYVQSSEPDKRGGYFVAIGLDGRLTCTCYRYENPRLGQERDECRHCNEVRSQLMSNPETAVVLRHPVIQPTTTHLASDQELNLIGKIANTVIKTRGHAIPASIDTPAKAAAIMLAGYEHGVKPMTALRHFFVVNGRTEPDAQIMAAICQAKEPSCYFEIAELEDTHCTVRFYRPQRKEGFWEYTYFLDDAKKAGLIKGGGVWEKFPKDMMRHGAIKRLCRMAGSDLINLDTSVVVAKMAELLEEGDGLDIVPDELVDLDQIPQETLYNEGDEEPNPVIMDSEPDEGQQRGPDTTAAATTPPPSPPDEGQSQKVSDSQVAPKAAPDSDSASDGPPDPRIIERIKIVQQDIVQSWGINSPEYAKLYDDLRKSFGRGRLFEAEKIETQGQALACLEELRFRRGDPDAIEAREGVTNVSESAPVAEDEAVEDETPTPAAPDEEGNDDGADDAQTAVKDPSEN